MPVSTLLRSPRNKLAGWYHLPRFIDKIRLDHKGELPQDYTGAFLQKGFDALWVQTSKVNVDAFLALVRGGASDSEIESWVKKNSPATAQEIESFNQDISGRGTEGPSVERLAVRKKESGFENREDIRSFFDLIDADEGRL